MPAGRPSLYRETYINEVVTFCEQGYSLTAFAGEIGVDRATITRWAEEHEQFRIAVNRAKAKRARWWEDQARRVAENGGPGGQATMVIFGLKNHAPDDFRDKTETEHTIKYADLSDDQLEAERRRLSSKREAAGD